MKKDYAVDFIVTVLQFSLVILCFLFFADFLIASFFPKKQIKLD